MATMTGSEKRIRLVLLATLTCIATMLIKLPAPGGYVNLGDGFVLSCGMILGPISGAIAAGTGSALADIINGYSHLAPVTFVIKALTATTAAICYKRLARRYLSVRYSYVDVSVAGAAGELCVPAGYYIFHVISNLISGGHFNRMTIMTQIRDSLYIVPYDLLQAAIGIAVTAIVTPLLVKLFNLRTYG